MPMRRMAPLLLCMTLLVGCSSNDGRDATVDAESVPANPLAGVDISGASPEQANEIADQTVSSGEYQTAFQRFRECLSNAGFELTDVDTSGAVYDYSIPDAAVVDGAEDDCYRAEFYYVDLLWQTTPENLNNSETADFTRQCLRSNNIEPEESLEAMNRQLQEAEIDISTCV